ncbi:hypothetical protein [Streptomyces sp. NBC_00690]|uniref:hypothetical protein n=1 Tax=Streptomyces sp. NBC_00690 TaxID=2975808 RepID=UPI002E2B6DE3|nr:hypothetical protein [Streptomyces sp. NBC_00690]
MGEPSGLPGVLTVMIDGDTFEDCPALAVGYLREPDRIEIRYVNPVIPPAAPPAASEEPGQRRAEGRPVGADVEAVTVREIADAWHRVTHWLQHNAPDSYAALCPGAGAEAIASLERTLGFRVPVGLRALWLLTAGDEGGNGWGCLPGNMALMNLDAVAAVHRLKTDDQAHHDTLNADRSPDERITVWKAVWIPFVALGPSDSTSGLYLDAETGCLGQWSRYGAGPEKELDTLVTYLEEAADMLEAPNLATRDKPGLIDGALVWLSSIDPAGEDRWRPLTG